MKFFFHTHAKKQYFGGNNSSLIHTPTVGIYKLSSLANQVFFNKFLTTFLPMLNELRSEALMGVTLIITVFCYVRPCNAVAIY